MKRSALLLTVVFLILTSGIASAQQSDISFNVIGTITNNANGKGLTGTATQSGGGLFSFRHFSNQHSGFEANYSYTKNSQKLSDQSSGASIASTQASIHELTVDYVFRTTYRTLQPFAFGGGGLLIFSPTSSAIDATMPHVSRQTRPAFLFGGGVDVRMYKNLALRAQYRGFLFEAPDFYGDAVALHTSAVNMMSEPSVGVVLRF